jgi:hypothetical protein
MANALRVGDHLLDRLGSHVRVKARADQAPDGTITVSKEVA